MSRKLTEMRLDEELRRARSFLSLRQAMALVFEADAPQFRTYLSAMLTAFDCDVDDADDALLQVIRDAWNFFPHRFLDGRCPAEVFDGLAADNKNV
jgi:hypothetical protein